MNVFKSIKLTLFASVAMTSVLPSVSMAMANNRRPAANNTKSTKKMVKRPFWKRISWEYWVAGGSAVVGIIALIWHLNKQAPGSGRVVPHDRECTICLDNFYDKTQMNKPIQCLNCPRTGGQGHFFHQECLNGWKNSERSLGRRCPICRDTGALVDDAQPAQRGSKK